MKNWCGNKCVTIQTHDIRSKKGRKPVKTKSYIKTNIYLIYNNIMFER